MRTKALQDYVNKKYQNKPIEFMVKDFVQVIYKPYGKKDNKTFRGTIIAIKRKAHLTSITVRSKSDDLHKTIELSLPFYREDVHFSLINRKLSPKTS